MRILVLVITIAIGLNAIGQNRIPSLSSQAEISILTIGKGPQLYDSFGHTAVRVSDPSNGIDIVFNYGLFDFDTPNFYSKFARGKLLYRLGITPFDKFLKGYKAQQRSIEQQILLQTPQEKKELFEFLVINAQEGNDKYLYDFLFDNCATRPANAIDGIYKEDIFKSFIPSPEGLSHRQLIQRNVPWNTWGSFGMDIAIGAVTDRKIDHKAYLFLPEYTKQALDEVLIVRDQKSSKLTAPIVPLYIPEEENTYGESFATSPLIVFGLLSVLILWVTYRDYKKESYTILLDKVLLSLLGVIGVLLALLWFATEHSTTKWNYNLLWAFPFHIIAAISLSRSKNKKWLYPYFKLSLILLALMCFHWIVGVQQFPFILLPFCVAIAIRYIWILKSLKKDSMEKLIDLDKK